MGPQYGSTFDVFTGMPEGEWCPEPPVLGGLIGAFMGGPQAVAVFEVRESLFGGDIEVQVDTNAKKAYEADYWKGVLDAQGKDDGTYYLFASGCMFAAPPGTRFFYAVLAVVTK